MAMYGGVAPAPVERMVRNPRNLEEHHPRVRAVRYDAHRTVRATRGRGPGGRFGFNAVGLLYPTSHI